MNGSECPTTTTGENPNSGERLEHDHIPLCPIKSCLGLFVTVALRGFFCVSQVMVELLIFMFVKLKAGSLICWYVFSLGLWGRVKLLR